MLHLKRSLEKFNDLKQRAKPVAERRHGWWIAKTKTSPKSERRPAERYGLEYQGVDPAPRHTAAEVTNGPVGTERRP